MERNPKGTGNKKENFKNILYQLIYFFLTMILKMLFWIYITVIHNQLKQNICKLHLLKLFWCKPVSIGGKLSKIWRGTKMERNPNGTHDKKENLKNISYQLIYLFLIMIIKMLFWIYITVSFFLNFLISFHVCVKNTQYFKKKIIMILKKKKKKINFL